MAQTIGAARQPAYDAPYGLRPEHKAGWTDPRVESLKKLWQDGKSASCIAKELGGGVTRNAVISKVHRLGLEPRDAATQRLNLRSASAARTDRGRGKPKDHAWRVAANIRAVSPVRMAGPTAASEPVTMRDLRSCCCKWPIGVDPGPGRMDEQLFCGAPAMVDEEGKPASWCEKHHRSALDKFRASRSPPKLVEPAPRGAATADRVQRRFSTARAA